MKRLNLVEIAARLKRVDEMLMQLVKRRLDLALLVEEAKSELDKPEDRRIYRSQIEIDRLNYVRGIAKAIGMNPEFAAAFLYDIIGESCKQQTIQREQREVKLPDYAGDEQLWQTALDNNLLSLTESLASTYDDGYAENFFATRSYLDFERQIIDAEIAKLPSRELLIDLGCATGRLTFQLMKSFKHSVGYDISPHMIDKADSTREQNERKTVEFEVADLQQGISQADNSVSFVVMNMGTASDIRELPKVLKEISSVLMPHGRFFLSFYNAEALLYRWDFIPWPTGLAAEVNTTKDCLDVHKGEKVLSVYARPYTVDEVIDMIKGGITVTEIQTYPTVSAILPSDLFIGQADVQKSVAQIDSQLATSTLNGGAYIIVTGQKVA